MFKEPIMPRVSFRTLTLMVLLLIAVVTHQYVNWTPPAHAGVIWLAGDDPNEPTEPEPEISDAGLGLSYVGDDPNEPTEPMPEIAWTLGSSVADDDPNEPTDPGPEAV